jgi:hypothetical protein
MDVFSTFVLCRCSNILTTEMEQIALDFFLPSCGVTEMEEDDKDVL